MRARREKNEKPAALSRETRGTALYSVWHCAHSYTSLPSNPLAPRHPFSRHLNSPPRPSSSSILLATSADIKKNEIKNSGKIVNHHTTNPHFPHIPNLPLTQSPQFQFHPSSMAPSSSSPLARGTVAQYLSVRRREKRPSVSPSRMVTKRKKKYRSMEDIMRRAKFAVVDDYSHVSCCECGSGENDDQLLLCDKCDKACHMLCLRPIVVRVPIGPWYCPTCSDHPPPVQRAYFFPPFLLTAS